MLWTLLLIICGCGALGGLINAFMVRDTLLLPRRVDGATWQFGVLGNIAIGAAAAGVSWGLYGTYSTHAIWPPPPNIPTADLFLTLSAATMAFLTGIGGTKWLNAEVQNDLWQSATMKAAAAPADPNKVSKIASMTALQAYQLFSTAGGDFSKANLSELIAWMGTVVRHCIELSSDPEILQKCKSALGSLAALAPAAVADGLAAAFDASASAQDKLNGLVKKMQDTAGQINQQQQAVGTVLGIVTSLVGIFSAASGGTGAVGTIIGQIDAAGSAWLS